MDVVCEVAAVCVGIGLRIVIPILIIAVLGWILHRILKDRNGKPKGEGRMSTRLMRGLVWLGTLLAGGTVILWLNRIFPHTGVIFLIGALYLVSGCVLDGTVQTYSESDRRCFTQKYGRWFPFLLGLAGPFYLAWEFFVGLSRY